MPELFWIKSKDTKFNFLPDYKTENVEIVQLKWDSNEATKLLNCENQLFVDWYYVHNVEFWTYVTRHP